MKLKKLLSLFMALLLALSALMLSACKDTGDGTETDGSTSEDISDESTSDSSKDDGEDESRNDGGEDGEDGEGDQKPVDPADIIDPNAPENVDLEIIKNGASEYVIVYDSSVDALGTEAESLSSYINTQFGVELLVFSDESVSSNYKKKIIIGDADDNAAFVKNKLYSSNDFAVDVCGDDLILYAANEYVYEYMFEIAKTEFFTNDGEQTSLTVAKDGGFIYHKSEYSDYNYAQYLRLKNGSIDYNGLLSLFEEREYTAEDGTKLPYRLYIPSSYDPENETTPLLIFLHGAGERGNDNQKQLKNFVPDVFSQTKSVYANAIIIAPQCPAEQQWVDTPWANGNYSVNAVAESNELRAVVELIGEIGDEFKPDTSRYYVAGLSMGGFGTWDLIMRHTELFAAAFPICGGADPTQVEKLKELPIYTIHGDADPTVPYAGTKAMADAFEEIGAENFRFATMPGYKHNVWSEAGGSSSYGKWLFGQVKSDAQ